MLKNQNFCSTTSPTDTQLPTSKQFNNNNKMKTDVLTVQHQYQTFSGKPDMVREVVMKYIDHFYPDASGTSAVAIDNKIEQAMDLVKSHLMIAVREEVEVLKERISELMDRINQLEVENSILKANVSSETLSQLQLQGSIQATQPQQTVQTQQNAVTQSQTTTTTSTSTVSNTTGIIPTAVAVSIPPPVASTNTANGPVP